MKKVKIKILGKIIPDPILENKIVWFPERVKARLTKNHKIAK
jgi:hypothetical protein